MESHLLLICFVGLVNSYSYRNNYNYMERDHKYFCDDLSPYFGEIDLDQVIGTWHGVEKIPHDKGEYRIEYTKECFFIDIKEVHKEPPPQTTYPPPPNMPYSMGTLNIPKRYPIRNFVLEWNEGLWRDVYHIKVNTSHNGFWQTDLPDTSVENMYRHFGGVIQVLRAAKNYLVLNFCLRLPHSQLYSVVLSRSENQLTAQDLANIHNIFTAKHLSTSALQRVCDNGASTTVVSGLLLSILLLLRIYS